MLGEHTMTVNFSYRAIFNLTFDLDGRHFSKWPPGYTCLNISVSNPRRNCFWCLNIHFKGSRITKKTIINTQI